jgi:dihydropteroate synthase
VARAAVAAGAEIINDVSAFQWDPQMAFACAELKCGVVLMHTRGQPSEWRRLPRENDITLLVKDELADRAQVALEHGIERARIVLDPGLGFGKNFEENYPLLAHLSSLHSLGFPLLAGASRKSFIGRSIEKRIGQDAQPADRLYGSLAAMVVAVLQGTHIVRVHDVKSSLEAAAIADEVIAAGSNA